MGTARKKILLVDDSKTSIFMERMILQKRGFELVTACNGEEAVLAAVEERPDLILMDVVMPKMNGFEAVKKIREVEAISTTPIIMVTTRGEGPNVEVGYESGCNDYVTKPIDGTELLSKIDNLLAA